MTSRGSNEDGLSALSSEDRPSRASRSRSGKRLPSLARHPAVYSDPNALAFLASSSSAAIASSSYHNSSNPDVAMLQEFQSPRSPDALLGSSSFVSVSTPYDVLVPTPTSESSVTPHRRGIGASNGNPGTTRDRDSLASSTGLSAASKERLTFVSERSVTRDSATELARVAKNERRTTVGDFTFDNPRDSNLRESIRRIQAYSRREVPLEYEIKSEVLFKKRRCELVLDREVLEWKCKSRVRGQIDTDDIVGASTVEKSRNKTSMGCFCVHFFLKGRGRNEKALCRRYRTVEFACEAHLVDRWVLAIQELVRWQARAPPIAQKRKIKVILNPHSGKRRARKIWYSKVEQFFILGNFDCNIEETTYGGHGIEMGKAFSPDDGYEALVFVGGDGTLCEFMNGLLSRPEAEWREIVATTPISLISAGTQNAFGTGVGIPTIEAAVYCILKRKMRPLDVVTAVAENDRKTVHFSYCGLAWGVGGDIAAESERYRWLGTARYTFLKLKRSVLLPKRHTGRVRFVACDPEPQLREYYDVRNETGLDQFEVEEGNVYDGDVIDNAQDQMDPIDPIEIEQHNEPLQHAPSLGRMPRMQSWRQSWTGYGGALRSPASLKRFHESMWEVDRGQFTVVGACNTAPDAKYAHPSDGCMDLLMLRKGNLWHQLCLGIRYLIGHETKSSLMTYRKCRAIVIEPDQMDDCMNIDGEVLSGPGPWRMEIVPSLFKALSEK